MGDHLDHLQILRIGLQIAPEIKFTVDIRRGELGGGRIPAFHSQRVVISLGGEKVRKKHVSQLVGEHAGDDLIAVFPATHFRDGRVARVDDDIGVVGCRCGGVPGLPDQIDPDAPVIVIAPGLRRGQILVMPGKDAGGEKLAVGDLAALFVEKLLDAFVIHPAQGSNLLFVYYAVLRCAFGAKIGSKTELISASRSASSAVALLITV